MYNNKIVSDINIQMNIYKKQGRLTREFFFVIILHLSV